MWLEESSSKHIALLASYGMGKTSFLKYYTMYLSKKLLQGQAVNRFPIFISLTNTSPLSNDGINTSIESFVAKNLGVNYNLFKKLVRLGKVVFILDRFDEIGFMNTKKQRFKQFNSIWKLATKNNKIILSGRPSYIPNIYERKNVLNVLTEKIKSEHYLPYSEEILLEGFNEKQIIKSIKNYYDDEDLIKQYK